jgi:hypothetical protein
MLVENVKILYLSEIQDNPQHNFFYVDQNLKNSHHSRKCLKGMLEK